MGNCLVTMVIVKRKCGIFVSDSAELYVRVATILYLFSTRRSGQIACGYLSRLFYTVVLTSYIVTNEAWLFEFV